ncbi:hypothetical protein [Paracoccus versutus]
MNLQELEGIAALDVLAEGWRQIRAPAVGKAAGVEDWSARLDGSA